MTISVTVFGSYLAASRAQCIACWVISSLCGWAYPISCHLYWKAVPNDPKILSLMNGEKYFVQCVEHVTGEEKYECEMLNVFVMMLSKF